MKIASLAPFSSTIGVEPTHIEAGRRVQRARSHLAAVDADNSSQTEKDKKPTHEEVLLFVERLKRLNQEHRQGQNKGRDERFNKRKKAIASYAQIDDRNEQLRLTGTRLDQRWYRLASHF